MNQSIQQHEVYEAPAIVYEGMISTRAGTPIGRGESNGGAIDLFSSED